MSKRRVEINTYDSNHHLILSFCRVFTNVFTAKGYHSIGCILADLDSAQAKGLGLALHDLDHERDWETHLTFIFKSCLVHFECNLYHKAFEKNTKNLIRQIPSTSSKDEVNILLQQINDGIENIY
ncbi:unnamed protein product [Rhizophagus irregularis]|uniref:MULE transposase domain-containing protein n=1 Tax=Rhizophagus irregularis TaxID=588596 RepID=A0A2N1MJ69_9GLOM|nr:hypothetical protein RhiirC2_791440 [Rhizophagus irregularis]CAB4397636.1 unnamed protein product [Rhizophagus irregularis]